MPPDPKTKELLKLLEKQKLDLSDDPIVEIRNALSHSGTPADLSRLRKVENIVIEHGGFRIPARVYQPASPSGGLTLYFHGGGYVAGTLESCEDECAVIAEFSENTVISVDYRLAPEHKFPAAQKDACNSFLWATENAASLDIDRKKIAMAGSSAGAGIALSATAMLRDEGHNLPAFLALFYPPVSHDISSQSIREFGEGYWLTRKALQFFAQQVLEDPRDVLNPYFSPLLLEDLSGMPETLIVTAEYDPLRDAAETMVSRMQESGVRATGIRVNGTIHGFLAFRHLLPVADSVLKMVSSLIRIRLRNPTE